jgi:hypothetical protein
MTAVPEFDHDEGVVRWGGLAGILGGILFIAVFVIVGVFVGAVPADPAEAIARFPDIRAARTVENGLYLVVLILWAVHFVALGRVLRVARPAPALFGSVLGIAGLVVLAAGALPHAASVAISDLYHAPTATPGDQATLALVWQAIQAIFNALLVTGLVILPLSLLALGVAMLGSPAFGRAYGWASVALGVVAAAAAVALLIDPLSLVAVVGVFALIVFHLAVGWRMYRLSRSPAVPAEDRRLAAADVTA